MISRWRSLEEDMQPTTRNTVSLTYAIGSLITNTNTEQTYFGRRNGLAHHDALPIGVWRSSVFSAADRNGAGQRV